MMGVVYEALDPALGRTIALKTIRLAFPVTPEENAAFEQRFLSEARIAARLSHPGIVVVHDTGRDPSGTLFIAMEYLEGRTLDQAVKPPLDWREALRLGQRLAEALHHAHVAGVVHRDIKPANIMILPSGEPKITDFGIAKMETARLHITATGQSMGTPLYMSPEQALGHDVGARSDQFSLGAILYWLLTGRLAFGADSMMAILGKVMHQSPPPPSQVQPGLPAAVDGVVARSLAKIPSARYESCGALAAALAELREGRPLRHAPESPATAEGDLPTLELTDVERPRRRSVAGLAAAAVVAGLVLLAVFVSRRGAPTPASPSPPAATPASEAREESPEPSPSSALGGLFSALQGEKPAQLAIDFEHPLRSGTLKVWVDGEALAEEKVGGRITKKVIGLTLRKGTYHDVLEVKPGRHEIQVQVRWEDGERTERIVGTFNPGTTRRLDVTLGRLLKDLTLEWK